MKRFVRSFTTTKEEKLMRMDIQKNLERKMVFEEASKTIPSFDKVLEKYSIKDFKREKTTIFQINIGKLCNLTCHHCHVESGPTKTVENMSKLTLERCLHVLKKSKSIDTVDITGGAPEMNPNFKYLVEESTKLGHQVMDRCNLTILLEKGNEDSAEFLAKHKVHIIASLPCYTLDNVDKQRGKGVFNESIEALKILNSFGYGENLNLSLVYNPGGVFLPGNQKCMFYLLIFFSFRNRL